MLDVPIYMTLCTWQRPRLPLLGAPQICSIRQYLDCILIGKGKKTDMYVCVTCWCTQMENTDNYFFIYELFSQI